MNTPAHMIFAAAAFARSTDGGDVPARVRAWRNAAAVLGGFAPDASLYILIAWQRWVAGRSFMQIFEQDYRSPLFQDTFAVDNSIPLWSAALALALILGWRAMAIFAASGLLHLAFDLALHNSDARPQFWPFTDWMFRSPVSYWDPAYYGSYVAPLEAAAALFLSWLLWRRFSGAPARALIVLGAAAEISPMLLMPVLIDH